MVDEILVVIGKGKVAIKEEDFRYEKFDSLL